MVHDSSKADFSLADGHDYMLESSHAAACRLNLQFYLWKQALHFNIHPSIPIQKSAVVADVATGTAIWLLDVAREHPTAQLDGFDNDISQAPHPKWLPPNVNVRHWDIFEEVPEDMIAKYDFVHVRLLVLVIKESNPRQVISNLLKMLKPGGYLQWDELDCANMHVKKVEPSLDSPALEQLRQMCWADGRHDWTIQLPHFLTEGRFLDAKLERFGDPTELIRAFNEQHLFTMEVFAVALVKAGKQDAAAAFYKVIGDSYRESITGAALCIPRVVCVAQKSLA
ncbi:hypothetical protein G7Y89_g12797 [Cudoniella acicularis]|uniref:Methyltransferase domain-containing protein n=1 Tax=Cudoniella acicularis TaxID=354080 RepID=A0A8H4RB53_9HELO|nr:hypothetical protein G7Y89_g12797 [Cudoniella acicularis]